MTIKFNVDTDAVIKLTNNLEKLSKSAFPIAVRGTLNSLAFDVKKNTMPRSALTFKKREKNFFKANSTVHMAKGFNIKSMKSKVGFTDNRASNEAVEDLEQQEHGGNIDGRKYIPVNTSRTSKSNRRKVSKKNRLGTIGIKNIVRTKDVKGKNEGEKFNKAVFKAGKGGFVQSTLKSGVKMVWRVNSLKRSKNGRFKLTAVYIVNDSKKVKVKGTGFMKKATAKTAKKADDFYIEQAERRFERALKAK